MCVSNTAAAFWTDIASGIGRPTFIGTPCPCSFSRGSLARVEAVGCSHAEIARYSALPPTRRQSLGQPSLWVGRNYSRVSTSVSPELSQRFGLRPGLVDRAHTCCHGAQEQTRGWGPARLLQDRQGRPGRLADEAGTCLASCTCKRLSRKGRVRPRITPGLNRRGGKTVGSARCPIRPSTGLAASCCFLAAVGGCPLFLWR